VDREKRGKFHQVLTRALGPNPIDLRPLVAKHKGILVPAPTDETERIGTSVEVVNDRSETRTVVEIETEDRLGLLFVLAQAMSELALDILLAKINTEKGAAIDSFYVVESGGGKLEGPERVRGLEKRLRQAIQSLNSLSGQ
jgi:[protein-PII] uridylyltransferase